MTHVVRLDRRDILRRVVEKACWSPQDQHSFRETISALSPIVLHTHVRVQQYCAS